MPSPFPGMNPYLEQEDAWHDFHESFMPRVRDLISAQVDPRYIVKIDEHVFIHEFSAEQRRFLGRADISVGRGFSGGADASHRTAATVLDAPAEGDLLAVDIERLAFLEIRDRRNRQLVTLIELLSPANKRPGGDRDQYLAKRQEILGSTAHLVEIDLLRGGQRPPVEELPDCDYCVLVTGADVALLPGVGYGVAIPAGPITAAQLRQLIPHDGTVFKMPLAGTQIRDILEQSVENVFSEDAATKVGGMIQVSGIRFRFDPRRSHGSRVVELADLSGVWDHGRTYLVATNSLLAQGGHNYREFLRADNFRQGQAQYETVKRWIKEHSPVVTPPPGRIGQVPTT